MNYLIDGYNMIHRITDLRSHLTGSLEQARAALIARLTAFARHPHHQLTVIFDGDAAAGERKFRPAGIAVRFARPPQNADALIKKIIDEHPKKKDLTVVSSDMAVFRYAKASGCVALSSESFDHLIRQAEAAEPQGQMQQKNNPKINETEIQEWMQRFNDRPDDDER